MKISYVVNKIQNKRNYRRISNEIKKIKGIQNINLNSDKNILYIEYSEVDDLKEKVLKCFHIYEKHAELVENISKEVYRKVLRLEGLDCGHCAARIESLAQKTLEHEKIVVDFSTERFILETKDIYVYDNAITEVSRIAHKIDPNIKVSDDRMKRNIDEEKHLDVKYLVLFIVGLLIALGFIIYKSVSFRSMRWIVQDYDFNTWDQIILGVSFICVGAKVIISFFQNIFSRHEMDEKFLMTVASIGAIATGHNIEAVSVMAFYTIGQLLQEYAVNHSRKSIKELLTFEVQSARLKVDDEEMEVDIESVLPGDILVVKVGEMIPVDGIVTSGRSYVDMKALTGESESQNVKPGDKIRSGAINIGNVIEIKARKLYKDSTMSQILDMVENASATKAKTENFITKFAKFYTPVIIAIAVVFAIGFPMIKFMFDQSTPLYELFLGNEDINGSLYHSMVFLVISCPCALVISIPLAFFGGIGLASKRGILVKGSNYLEALNNVENVIFDKTGTLTYGIFGVNQVVSINEEYSESEIHKLLAYVEYHSTHPIGMSITDSYGRDLIFPEIIEDYTEVPGRGVRAYINGARIAACNYRQLVEAKINFEKVETSGLVVYLCKEKQVIGYAVMGDLIREEAKEVVQELKSMGVKKVAMLTGDNELTSLCVGKELEMDEIYYELLPSQKVEYLQKIKAESKDKDSSTIYIGDGINDAPVISNADVGIAMGGTGSEGSIAIADVVIMSDNLEKVSDAIRIARATKKIVVQNVIFALGVKLFVFVLNFLNIPVMIWLAIFSDVGVSLLAIINSLRVTGLFKKEQTKDE